MRLMLLNGPNLNLLGVREPHIYGSTTLAVIEQSCRACAEYLGATLAFHQSNHEGELVDLIQSARRDADAIIINPAGYSFTSIAINDALKAFEGPIIELHISNIHARDELHRHSKLSGAVKAVIGGLGPYGYIVAIQAAAQLLGRFPTRCRRVCAKARADLLRALSGAVCDFLRQRSQSPNACAQARASARVACSALFGCDAPCHLSYSTS